MENTIVGKVLDRKSGHGLEDLLVVLYDIDTVRREFSDMGVEGPIISDDDTIEPQIVDPTTSPVRNFTIGQATLPDATTWIDFPGDRLGSVLTDRRGSFKLRYDDDLFRTGDKERRPDLVLLVLGPDHSQGVSVVSRLLHYAYVPRKNAGRLESYIIHIERPTDQDDERNRLNNYFENWHSDARVNQRSRRHRARQRVARQLLPRPLANNPRFVAPRADAATVAEHVHTAIIEGLQSVRSAEARPAVIHLTADEYAAIGGTGTGTFRVNACDLLHRKGLGTDLVRIRSLIDRVRRNTLPDELDHTPPAIGSDGGSDEAPSVIPDEPDPTGFIAARILGQVDSLPVIREARGRSIIDDLQTIKDRINALEMSGGPANVTAFRDFHSLQIAFKNVWTAALDESLEADVLELFETINELNEDYGIGYDDPEALEDLTQLEDFLASIDADLTEDDRTDSIPDNVGRAYPQLTLRQWNGLSRSGQDRLSRGVNEIQANDLQTESEMRWAFAELFREVMQNPSYQTPVGRVRRLVLEISEKRNRPYNFRYYKENSVNYGILINYRQEWRPQNYQVGRLVSTLPLAPGESRELKVTQKLRLSRAEREMRKSLSENNYESASTVRSELDVLAKLSSDSNFKMSASGSFSLGIGSIESASEFEHNQRAESQRQHKQIGEATRKASEKVRQERELSIEQTTESELGRETTQKIHNPNNEVTVTYLMYELERRYLVSQSINRVTPVILVALDMPSPHEITEAWILEYAWILRRVLLDDAFEAAIAWVEQGRQAESIDIAVKRANYEREMASLRDIESNLDLVLAERRTMRSELIDFEQRKAEYEAGDRGAAGDVKDFFLSGGLSLFFGNDEPDKGELLQAAIDAAKSKLKHIDEAAEQLTSQQRAAKRESREAGTLYTEALKNQAQKDTAVQQFQLHIRQNIFHYMHAIWEMRHPDEVFFQLAEQEVYHLAAGDRTCELVRGAEPRVPIPGIDRPGEPFELRCSAPELPDFSTPEAIEALKRPLGEVAHVDQLLGFKGNYAIFPLKDCTPLTDYMMQEFVDDLLGVRDPATELGVSTGELIDYARAALREETLSADDAAALKQLIADVISSPSFNTEEIILPTGQIYMEALKGEQALLEDFKLAHRGLDVLRTEEKVRSDRLENLRRAGRMVSDPPDYSDSDIDKHIVVDRGTGVDVDVE